MDEREERQRELRDRNQEQWDAAYLTIAECARLMKVSRATALRLFRFEPGVELWRTPGSHRPIVRVPRHVYEAVARRSANPRRKVQA